MTKRVGDQPPPEPSKGDVWRLVIDDMQERRRVGIERYGTPLQPFNGRDSLVDAYQEQLDQVVYLRQEIEERRLSLTPELLASALAAEEIGHDPGCASAFSRCEIDWKAKARGIIANLEKWRRNESI